MNLLEDPWIPVRAHGGTGAFQLLTYRQLLCEPGEWQVSLPRDDLELACVQLLVCMTQVMFLPKDNAELRARTDKLLTPEEFDAGIAPFNCKGEEWFDLDHPTQPFMQTRGAKAEKPTPIQKILVGLPEGNNHAFFNEVGEVKCLSAALTAISLFNQAANANSMGGGFKGNLRGGTNPYLTPVNIFVFATNLRRTVWRNVLTLPRIQRALPDWAPNYKNDQPTWIKPIQANETIQWNDIGLARGLFWQPAKLELIKENLTAPCDMLAGNPTEVYSYFRKEQFKFTVNGLWPHPHGAQTAALKDGQFKWKFESFYTDTPAWTHLSEFVVQRGINSPDAKDGSQPSGPVSQAEEMGDDDYLNLMVGGYCAKQGSIVGRRHEMIGLASGWKINKQRLTELIEIGKGSRRLLYKSLLNTCNGYENKKRQIKLKGIGSAIRETAEKLFYARTESLIHETFSNEHTWKEWKAARQEFANQLARTCNAIFEELTDPYAMKPELIPIIAWARRSMNHDLAKLKEEA